MIFLVLFLIYLTTFMLVASLIGDESPIKKVYNPFIWMYMVVLVMMTSYIARHTFEITNIESLLLVCTPAFLGIVHGGLYLLIEDTLVKNVYNEYYTI